MSTSPYFTPTADVVLKNIASIIPGFQVTMAYVFVFVACCMILNGFMDLMHLTSNKHNPSKIFGVGTSSGGALGAAVQIFIGGFIINFASQGELGQILSSVFFGENNTYRMININNYAPSEAISDSTRYARVLIFGLVQTMGVLAIFKAMRMAAAIARKTSKTSPWTAIKVALAGALCLQIFDVLDLVENTIGFSFFHVIGLL